ncbi:hypothetical protein CUMW_290100 [Citrus unshiu]|uniref:Uncharacterized protein n=1 Tax=Citrus unshiu TaxID=55188 RepID=A0A2H5QYA5_CITUN|nr:hypothetical protein CUMW_290100 [Citrus unshiu]
MEKLLVMYFTRKSIMLLRKYLLVTESQVSKCGFHIVKKKEYVLYPKHVVGVANRTVHNLVLEDMALKVIKLVVFHIEPLKQRVGL